LQRASETPTTPAERHNRAVGTLLLRADFMLGPLQSYDQIIPLQIARRANNALEAI
jgi:hypothetical protein